MHVFSFHLLARRKVRVSEETFAKQWDTIDEVKNECLVIKITFGLVFHVRYARSLNGARMCSGALNQPQLFSTKAMGAALFLLTLPARGEE